MVTTQEYAPGRLVDVHGEGRDGIVLLWHGRGPDSRTVVSDLAGEIAQHDVTVVVPDWSSEVSDGGKADLLASLTYARDIAAGLDLDPDRLVVTGWSLGGTAAVGLAIHAPVIGVRIAATVLLSPGDGPRALDPFTGAQHPDPMPAAPHAGPVDVVSATEDDIATPGLVRGLESRLRAAGWRTRLTDVAADHGSIAMTRYDAVADRFVPADDERTVTAGRQVAAIVAAAATSSG